MQSLNYSDPPFILNEEAFLTSSDLHGIIFPLDSNADYSKQILPYILSKKASNLKTSKDKYEAIAQVKETMYRAAVLRPRGLMGAEEETGTKPMRKNLRISNDPQTAAARRRRERISERLRTLQRLVPGGKSLDTASMLEEAANYLKFLKAQVSAMEKLGGYDNGGVVIPIPFLVGSGRCSNSREKLFFPFAIP